MIRRLLFHVYYQFRYVLPIWLVQLLTNWLPENRLTIRLRGGLIRPFLGRCGRGLTLARGITFLNPHGICVGEHVYIATGCWIDGIGGLTIEDEVKLSPYVVITTSSHCFRNNSVRGGGSRTASVRIGKGSWIASHATLAAGSRVGSGTIIGANAVVTKDIPDNVFAAGVPARVIGPRKDAAANVFRREDAFVKAKDNKQPPSICILTTISNSIKAFYPGQIEALMEAGFRVSVVCAEDAGLPSFLPAGVEYVPMPFTRVYSPVHDLKALFQLIRFFRRNRFTMVQYSTPKASLLGSLASFAARIPCRIYLLWGLYYTAQAGFSHRVLRFFEKAVCRMSHHILPIAHEMVDYLEQEGIARRGKCAVILNGSACGVDLERFNPALYTASRSLIRRQYSIPEDALVIGTVARLTGDKGIHELVDAFAEIEREVPNVYLLLVGRQEEKDRLRPQTAELIQKHPAIRCAGWQKDPVPFYAAMDIFCLPTYREGFGEVNLEAQAMGLPVVSSDVIGPRESVENGVTGFLVPPRDVPSLKEALLKLVRDASLRESMGLRGRERVVKMFDRKEWIQAMVTHRLELLKGMEKES